MRNLESLQEKLRMTKNKENSPAVMRRFKFNLEYCNLPTFFTKAALGLCVVKLGFSEYLFDPV